MAFDTTQMKNLILEKLASVQESPAHYVLRKIKKSGVGKKDLYTGK